MQDRKPARQEGSDMMASDFFSCSSAALLNVYWVQIITFITPINTFLCLRFKRLPEHEENNRLKAWNGVIIDLVILILECGVRTLLRLID